MSLESSVARPVRAGFSHPWVGDLGMPLFALVCFVLVFICFLAKFLVKAPSLTWLIQGKRRFFSTWMRKPEGSRGRTRGYWAEAKGNSGQLPWPLFSKQFL